MRKLGREPTGWKSHFVFFFFGLQSASTHLGHGHPRLEYPHSAGRLRGHRAWLCFGLDHGGEWQQWAGSSERWRPRAAGTVQVGWSQTAKWMQTPHAAYKTSERSSWAAAGVHRLDKAPRVLILRRFFFFFSLVSLLFNLLNLTVSAQSGPLKTSSTDLHGQSDQERLPNMAVLLTFHAKSQLEKANQTIRQHWLRYPACHSQTPSGLGLIFHVESAAAHVQAATLLDNLKVWTWTDEP